MGSKQKGKKQKVAAVQEEVAIAIKGQPQLKELKGKPNKKVKIYN